MKGNLLSNWLRLGLTTIGVLLVLANSAAPMGSPVTWEVALGKIRPETSEAEVAVELRLLEQGARPEEELRVSVSLGEPKRLMLERGRRYRIRCADERYWCPEQELEADADRRVEIQVLERGTVEAELRGVPQSTELSVELEFWNVPLPNAPGVGGRVPCAVEAGRIRCRPPAGTWDLWLRPKGWAPSVFWGVKVPAGGKRVLGSIPLQSGGTVVGRLNLEGDSKRTSRCEVKARKRVPDTEGDPKPLPTADLPSTQATFSGAFALVGVAPGFYDLEVACPPNRRGVKHGVMVNAGVETRLSRAISLHETLGVSARLDPPLDPQGAPWSVILAKASMSPDGFFASPHQKTSAVRLHLEGELYRADGLAPGIYFLWVSDSLENLYLKEQLVVEESFSLDFNIELVEVEGRVTQGGTPVPARVQWVNMPRAWIQTETDPDGRYQLLLPTQPQVWTVEVLEGPEPKTTLGKFGLVLLPKPNSRGRRVRDFELGEGELQVRCLSSTGKLLRGCQVELWMEGTRRFLTSDATGLARFRGIRSGEFAVQGRAGELSSCLVLDRFLEGEKSKSFDLYLGARKPVSGTIQASGEGLPGVRIEYRELDGSGRVRRSGSVISGPKGGFRFWACSDAERVELVAFPIGGVLSAKVERALPGLMAWELEGSGAFLEVRGEALDEPQLHPWWLELSDGSRVTATQATRWAAMNGLPVAPDRVSIPGLPAGTLRVCWADPVAAYERWSRSLRLPEAEGCRTVRLRAGEWSSVEVGGRPGVPVAETAGGKRL